MPGQTGWTVLKTPVRLVSTTSFPLLGRHLVEGRVSGDARVGDDHVDGPQIGLDLRDAGLGRVVIGHVPLVGLDAGLGGEGRGLFVVPA